MSRGAEQTFSPKKNAAAAAKSLQSYLTLEHWNGLPFPSPMHESER